MEVRTNTAARNQHIMEFLLLTIQYFVEYEVDLSQKLSLDYFGKLAYYEITFKYYPSLEKFPMKDQFLHAPNKVLPFLNNISVVRSRTKEILGAKRSIFSLNVSNGSY